MSDYRDIWSVRAMVRRAIPLLIVLSLLELGSGLVLETLQESFLSHPSLLVLVPSIIGMAGNLGSVLASRISTGLHLGTVEFSESLFDTKVVSDSIGVLLLAVSFSFVMGVFSYGFGKMTGGTLGFMKILSVSITTSVVLAFFVVFLSVSVVYFSYRKGIDPDDVAIPVVTNVSDIVGIVIFAGTVIMMV